MGNDIIFIFLENQTKNRKSDSNERRGLIQRFQPFFQNLNILSGRLDISSNVIYVQNLGKVIRTTLKDGYEIGI